MEHDDFCEIQDFASGMAARWTFTAGDMRKLREVRSPLICGCSIRAKGETGLTWLVKKRMLHNFQLVVANDGLGIPRPAMPDRLRHEWVSSKNGEPNGRVISVDFRNRRRLD